MRIKFPIIPALPELDEFLRGILYNKVKETKDWVAYEGLFEFGISRQNLRLSPLELVSFVRAVEVSGGHKKKRGDMVLVEPHRSKLLAVRFPEDYFELLKRVSRALGRKLSEHARLSVLNALQKALESIGWPHQTIEARKPFPYEEAHPIGQRRLSIRISKEQYDLLRKVATQDGLTVSQYARMVLLSSLPIEATVLKVTEPQTSKTQRNPR